MMKKIIIDGDPGHDDIIAFLVALAHKQELEILGFTTVCGNNLLDKVTNNILKVIDYLGIDCPVSKGADAPLIREPEPQPLAHGESGMDGPILDEPTSKVSDLNAVEFMKKMLMENDKVTIVGIGPLTNIALLLKSYPELKNKIEEIVIMGGSVYSGNIIAKAEFNIYHDPEAAKIVFNSKVPLTMAPIEVCQAGAYRVDEIDYFKDKGKVSKLVYDLLDFYMGYSRGHNLEDSPIFDMTTIIYLLKPEIFKYEMMNVDIECSGQHTRGMTVCEPINEYSHIKNPVKVLLDCDNEKHNAIFKESIVSLDKNNVL